MIELNQISYSYPFQRKEAVSDVNLNVKPGQAVLLTGASGCGKSTILRLANGLCPHFFKGRLEGGVRLNGIDTRNQALHEISRTVGTLLQDPEQQFFATIVEDEIAFAHEWRECSRLVIRSKVAAAISQFQLEPLRTRALHHLSEGEKQKVALASIVSLSPRLIVMDEPTANLDPETTLQLAQEILALKQAGLAILIADHRLHWLADVVDRVVVMAEGKVVAEGDFSLLKETGLQKEYGLRKPQLDDPRPRLKGANGSRGPLRMENMSFAYRNEQELFHDASFVLPLGVTALLGKNGAGKTTLARLLTGLTPMHKGRLFYQDNPVTNRTILRQGSLVLQNVDHQLHMKTVREELMVSAHTLMPNWREPLVEEYLQRLGLCDLAARHPQSLSGGEKQRLVIACGMIKQPGVLILDEPTSGLDGKNLQVIVELVRQMADQGTCVLLISHDLELIASACDFAIRLPILNESVNHESY